MAGGGEGSRLVMMTWWTSPMAPASMRLAHCLVTRIEAAVEGDHHLGAELLDLSDGGIGLVDVEIDRLFAEHRFAAAGGVEREVDMRIGRRADDDRLHIGRAIAARASVIASAPSAPASAARRFLYRIGDGHKLAARIERDIARMNFPDPPGSENGNSNHPTNLPFV